MTEKELAAVVQGIVPVVREYITKSGADVNGRLVASETRIAALEALLDKDAKRLEGYTSFLQRDLVTLTERVVVVEARPPQPGPPGPEGPAGKDGTPGLRFCGVYAQGKAYELGDLVTWAGSSWHCNEATDTKPGDGLKAWTLMVKRGRDGKDGKGV